MASKVPIGLGRDGEPIYVNLEFLDGTRGFYFAFFQALWFRMLIDAKMYEQRGQPPH